MEEACVPIGAEEAEFLYSVSEHDNIAFNARIESPQLSEHNINKTDHLYESSNSNIEHVNEVDLKSTHLPRMVESDCLVELCVSSWHPSTKDGNKQTYLRGCKWSPDGTCCLTVINNGGIQLLELPRDLYEGDEVSETRSIDVLDSVIKLPESGMIYDFCWYPGMNSLVPESCCWLTTRQHCPLQLWDAFDGGLRCSYRGYNAVDEMEPALSTCFSADGTQIHAGYKKNLKTFDTDRPGRECVSQKINSSASSLAVSPICGSLIAVGSWSTEISLYDIYEGKTKSIGKLRYHLAKVSDSVTVSIIRAVMSICPSAHHTSALMMDTVTLSETLAKEEGGVTHLQFLPDGTKLVSGARKDSNLLIWDVRFYKTPLKVLQRVADTNQRIYFDISRCGRYLVSGGTDGVVTTWDLSEEIYTEPMISTYKKTAYPLHSDCCNGVSIHPYRPILATSSGQHHIYNDYSHNDEEDDISMEETTIKVEKNIFKTVTIPETSELKNGKQVVENNLQFWWTGKSKTDGDSELNT